MPKDFRPNCNTGACAREQCVWLKLDTAEHYTVGVDGTQACSADTCLRCWCVDAVMAYIPVFPGLAVVSNTLKRTALAHITDNAPMHTPCNDMRLSISGWSLLC